MPPEEGLGCGTMSSYFPYGGAGDVPGYWEQSWSGNVACVPVGYQTPFSITAKDDYKRCICDRFGEGAADCPTAGADDESQEPDNQEDENDVPDNDEDEEEVPDEADEEVPDNGEDD